MPMPHLLQYLNSISPEAYDCIVHVGAGGDASADDYAALQPKHIVLIEADPEARAALDERFKDASAFTVAEALVSSGAGEAVFHRYTLSSLNAPLGLGRLREIYPRIEEVETMPQQGRPLHEIVGESRLGVRNLLILDIPGQEAAIVRSLPFEFLSRFGDLVTISAAQAWHEGAETAQSTLAALKQHDFTLERESGEDPAWPQFLLRHDSRTAVFKKELENSARLLVTKTTQIHQQSEQIQALIAERDDLSARLTARDTELAELVTRHSSLVTSHTDLTTLHQHLATERDELAEANRSTANSLDRLQGEMSALATERDELRLRLDNLREELRGLTERHEAVQMALGDIETQHAALVASGHVAADHIQALQQSLAEMESTRRGLAEENAKLLHDIKDLLSQRDTLAAQTADLKTEVAQSRTNARYIEEEFSKAEGQIELIKDIFLREALR
jgi:predicted  nucleic acid-binding Zn-ribbon protein